MWTAWEYKNCARSTMGNGDFGDFGSGSKTRRRLKSLDAEVWEEDVEEVSCTLPSQCINYKELNSLSRKSSYPSSGYCDNSGHTRDWKGAGWYRITGLAGTRLADTQIAESHCGTTATGSLSGGHPTIAQGEVARTINFNYNGNPARWTATAMVINCGAYYVYHLENSPNCHLGYCTV